MKLTKQELIEAVEAELQMRYENCDVEILKFVRDTISFEICTNEDCFQGYIDIEYHTDLSVYLKNINEVDYKFQFDILWCDILPEGVEL